MQTIVTGEIKYVNGNKLSICCMEQLSRFFRSWQSQTVCTLDALIKYMPQMWWGLCWKAVWLQEN